MDNILLESGGRELLERVKPLWEKLNEHHRLHSTYFKHHFSTFTFEMRQNRLMNEPDLQVYIDLAHDEWNQRDVGYCITSLSRSGNGEIESLFLEAEYRKFGLGDAFMKRALAWLEAHEARQRMINVAEGNEEVFDFYRRYGFYPRKTLLEYVPPEYRPDEGLMGE